MRSMITSKKPLLLAYTLLAGFTFLMLLSSAALADDDLKVEGYITSVGSDSLGNDSLVVNGYTFWVTAMTEFDGHDHMPFSFSDLQVDDYVEVKAQMMADGNWWAKKIEWAQPDNDMDQDLSVKGLIDSVGIDFIQVSGYTFFVTDSTEIYGEHHSVLSFSDLSAGMYVKVKARFQADSTYWARKIKVENEHGPDEDVEFKGTIDSLNTDYLVVGGVKVWVDSNTVVEGDHHMPLTYGDLSTGMYVEIEAIYQADGSLLAVKIEVEEDHANEIEIKGSIEAISGDTVTVSGVAFLTDSNTVILDHQRLPITLADLLVGQFVEVKGFQNADGSWYASKIKIEDFFHEDMEYKGYIDSLGTDWLAVLGNVIYVDSNTVVLDASRLPISFGDLTVGTKVEVKAIVQADGSLLAVRIKIEDTNANEIEMHGSIDTLGTDWITVSGVTFDVDANTMVFDQFRNPINFTDLISGLFVEIKGLVQTTGNPLAVKIKIEDSPDFSQVTGPINNVSGTSMSVSQQVVSFTSNMVVLDSQFNPVTVADIQPGVVARVWIDNSDPSNPGAMQVQLDPQVTSLTNPNPGTLPQAFSLNQNYPNPFNPTTTIPFAITGNGFNKVTLQIFNILGQKVKTLYNGVLAAGNYNFKWNGTNDAGNLLPSGVYFYQLKAGNNFIQVKRMLLVK